MKAKALPHPRFALFLVALASACVLLGSIMPWDTAVALGFDVAATMFVISVLPLWLHGSPAAMRSSAARDDGGRVLLLVVSAVLLLVVLVALGLVVGRQSTLDVGDLILVIVTLVLTWSFANLVYAFHYAHMFYDQTAAKSDHGGLTFPGDSLPDFADFCYFAFVLGMTFQVSDVEITSSRLRRTATFHGILAFFFNLGILALTINVLAGAL